MHSDANLLVSSYACVMYALWCLWHSFYAS